MRKANRRLIVLCVAALAAFLPLLACSPRHSRELRVASQPSAFCLPIFVAEAKGFFRDEGFAPKITTYNTQNAATTALLSGNADVSELGTTILSLQESSPGKVQLVYGQYSGGHSLIVPTTSPVRDLADLRNRKIGTWPSSTAAVYLHLLLDQRIGKGSFTSVPLENRFLNQAMAHGDVDVVFEADVYAAQAILSGQARYLARSAMAQYVSPHFFNGGGMILASLAQADPQLRDRIVKVFTKAIEYIHAHPDDSRRILAQRLEVSVDIATKAPLDEFATLMELDRGAVQVTADQLTQQGLLKKKIDVNGLF